MEEDGGGGRRMEEDGGGWRRMEEDGGGWRRMEEDGGGGRRMEEDGGGWKKMEEDPKRCKRKKFLNQENSVECYFKSSNKRPYTFTENKKKYHKRHKQHKPFTENAIKMSFVVVKSTYKMTIYDIA